MPASVGNTLIFEELFYIYCPNEGNNLELTTEKKNSKLERTIFYGNQTKKYISIYTYT